MTSQTPDMDIEKAYGGCHLCYGKGYATQATADSGYATDGDIGGPEGRYYRPYNRMISCTCERGKQLKRLLVEARSDELKNFDPLFKGDHRECINPISCIGYMNAESDFENEKEIRLTELQDEFTALLEAERQGL